MSHAACTPIDFEDLGPAALPWSRSYRLTSKTIGQDFLVEIAWPPVTPKPNQRFPVVYVLDGNHAFGMAALAARALQSGPFPMPPTLVVGIGYHFKQPRDHAQWGALRLRDLSPCPDPLLESQSPGASERCGGAGPFLDFIEQEVKPLVASSAPVDSSDQTLIGASLGGLFALHTLLTRPATFQRYIAVSPAIYWADKLLLRLEAELAPKADDLPAHLFLAAGGPRRRTTRARASSPTSTSWTRGCGGGPIPAFTPRSASSRARPTCRSFRAPSPAGSARCSAATATCTTGRAGWT
jgi:predicted alpha/beta superfamily hydrolase